MDETRAINIRADYITTFRDIKILTAASSVAREYLRDRHEKNSTITIAVPASESAGVFAVRSSTTSLRLPDLFPFSP